jgi:hypothetical protein
MGCLNVITLTIKLFLYLYFDFLSHFSQENIFILKLITYAFKSTFSAYNFILIFESILTLGTSMY